MSRSLVSKLDIDVLVTLGLYGPAETADDWRPWGQDTWFGPPAPDRHTVAASLLGAMLWRMNADNVLDPEYDDPLPDYAFEPVPCPITAVEGLKAIAAYECETIDPDQEHWPGSRAEAFCDWLEGALIRELPGYADAPWRWEPGDVDIRADRARIARIVDGGDPPPVPEDAATILETLAANGITLTARADVEDNPPVRVDPDFHVEQSRKIGHWASGNYLNRDQIQVRLYADETAAHTGFLLRRAVHEHVTEWPLTEWLRRLARHGRIVVELVRPADDSHLPYSPTAMPRTTRQQQLAALGLLGEPDETWSTDHLPIIAETTGGMILATGVALPTGHGPGGISVATDRAGLDRIAALTGNQHDREQVLAIDLDRHAAVMINGVAHIDDVTHTRLRELAAPPGAEPRYLLELTLHGTRWTPAVIVAIDKPPHQPTEAHIHHPDAGRSTTAYGVYQRP